MRHLACLAPVALGLLAIAGGCRSVPEDPVAGGADLPLETRGFSGERAFDHLVALAGIGPRVTGTQGAALARGYLVQQLQAAGLEVTEVRVPLERDPGSSTAPGSDPGAPLEAVHVVGILPGASPDRFVLAASYDTPAIEGQAFTGPNTNASGPAVVLELARVLAGREQLYTVMIVLLDGDSGPPSAAALAGSRAFAHELGEQGLLSHVRMAVFFDQVADTRLRVARDLSSHHVYRESFFEAARATGHERNFPPDAPLESVASAHLAFAEEGLTRVVVLSDNRYPVRDPLGLGGERPRSYQRARQIEEDTLSRCAPASLAAVGEVTLEALDRLGRRLSRIDSFRSSPLEDPAGVRPAAVPGSDGGRTAETPPAPGPASSAGTAGGSN